MAPPSDESSRLARWFSRNIVAIGIFALSAAATGWLVSEAIDHAALMGRLGDAQSARATVETLRLLATSPARWQATVAWKDESNRPRRSTVEFGGREFDAVEKRASIESVESAGIPPPRRRATVVWKDSAGRTQRSEIVLEAENATRGLVPARAIGDSLDILVNRRNPADVAWRKDRPNSLPFTLIDTETDLILFSVLVGMVIFVFLMAKYKSGQAPAPRPEIDAIGREELERRFGRIEQWSPVSLFMAVSAALIMGLLTGKFAWFLLLTGFGMLAPLLLPLVATLPFGRQRFREFVYYWELCHGPNSVWSMLTGAIWAVLGIACLIGAWMQW